MIDFMCNLFSGPCVRRVKNRVDQLEVRTERHSVIMSAVSGKVSMIEALSKRVKQLEARIGGPPVKDKPTKDTPTKNKPIQNVDLATPNLKAGLAKLIHRDASPYEGTTPDYLHPKEGEKDA